MAEDFSADDFIENWRRKRRDNYRNMPEDAKEHSGIEETVLAGGYGYRQVLELVQNGADAVLEEAETKGSQATASSPRRLSGIRDGHDHIRGLVG